MLDVNIDELEENVHIRLSKIIFTSYKYLTHYRNRVKAFAEGMFGYIHFNLNLEAFVTDLDQLIQESCSKFEYAQLFETGLEITSLDAFDYDFDLAELFIGEHNEVTEFLFLNYKFLESYRDSLEAFGGEIFEEVLYNTRLRQYVADYRNFLQAQFSEEIFEMEIEDHEGYTLTNGFYYNTEEGEYEEDDE